MERQKEGVRGLPINRRRPGEQLVRLKLGCLQAGGPFPLECPPLWFLWSKYNSSRIQVGKEQICIFCSYCISDFALPFC